MINNIKVKVENILNSVSETLFDNKGLKDILEVTYIYKDNFNITLFSDFAGLSKESSYTELVDITGQKLGNVTSKIDSIINKINNGDNGEDKEILLGYLYYMKNLLDITILGLPFEAKKSTGIIELKNEEILNRIKKIEKLENKVFGGLVKDNSFEVTKSHQYINNLLAKSSNKISENEFMFMNIILSKIRSLEAYDHNIKSEKSDNINQKESIIPDIDINRDDYVKIFKLILNIYDIKKDIIISNVANMYDGDNGIEVPNNEKYKSIKLEKVLKMIAHELETHGIILDNNEHILGAIKGGGQLPREEGLAKIAEGMLEGRSINDFRNISFSLPEILAGEILSAEEYEKFIDIYLKLTGKNKIYSTKDRILPKLKFEKRH